jgi:DNA-binding response OmpR family regulator
MSGSAREDSTRILVVEDNDDFRLLMELTLGQAGYRVDTASCAEDAVRLLKTRDYHLVISDYSLPAHSGAWLRSQLTAQPNGHNIPFLIVTGDPDAPGIPDDTIVITKPIDFDWLIGEVRQTLAHVSQPVTARVRARRLPVDRTSVLPSPRSTSA